MNHRADAISHPFAAPDPGVAREIAPGILWLRVPLGMPPGHVNALALDDGDGWTVIDPGLDTPAGRDLWTAILAGPLSGRPVRRVLVTHHHPDHVGLAAWFTERGAELVMTRTAFLLARMLMLDGPETSLSAQVAWWRRCGLSPEEIARRSAGRHWTFREVAGLLPATYTRIEDGQTLRLAGRDWLVRTGDGHAPEHATLWSGDLVIAGDQLLPGISPNLGTWATEPDADPVAEWLASCARLAGFATDTQLVLPGHKLPYRGLPHRLAQMQAQHAAALDRLEGYLTEPRRAVDCFGALYARPIGEGEFGLALAEALGHLNHLAATGRAQVVIAPDGAWLWQRT